MLKFSCRIKDPICVRKDALLEEVAQLVVDKHMHRVWVTDDTGIPISVVTLTDIIAVFNENVLEAFGAA